MWTEYVTLVCLVGGVFGISTNVTVHGLGNAIGLEETTSWTNRTIYTFRGIPYAEPPVGDLRFRPPVKVTTWNGDLNATEFGNVCPQNRHSATFLELSGTDEDCLTLNVYVPKVDSQRGGLPVMIYLHGGSFTIGFAQLYQPHHLLEEDVILVVPQFRLGLLGLLSLQTDEIPGNVQFLDQIMAMQWVRDNIRHFGGDPGRVTLTGQSSGAASVNLHQLSPLSRGLFHQAIMQSGSAFAEWAIEYDAVKNARILGSLVGCNQTKMDSLAACFKRLDVATILQSFYDYMSELYFKKGQTVSWPNKPVIQTAGTQRFLEEDPADLVARGEFSQMPMIGGVTKHEGTQILAAIYANNLQQFELERNEEFLKYNLTSLVIAWSGETDRTGTFEQTLTNMHFKEDEVGNFSLMTPGLVDMCGQLTIKSGVFRMIQSNSRVNRSYLYTFGYYGTKSMWKYGNILPCGIGVPHGDDIPYLFPIFHDLSAEDVAVAKRIVKLWTSFAATGKPVADGRTWEPMSTPFGPYLIIEEDLFDGTNFLSEHTVAAREGFKPVHRSLAFTFAPQSMIIFAATMWSILCDRQLMYA